MNQELTDWAETESSAYIFFDLSDETYGASTDQVLEIVSDFEITSLPHLPPFLHGVINRRGDAIPIIDLRKRFEISTRHQHAGARVLVFETSGMLVGALVDRVHRVNTVSKQAIKPTPRLLTHDRTPFVMGLVARDKKFTILLDLLEILTSVEQEMLSSFHGSLGSEPDLDDADHQGAMKQAYARMLWLLTKRMEMLQ